MTSASSIAATGATTTAETAGRMERREGTQGRFGGEAEEGVSGEGRRQGQARGGDVDARDGRGGKREREEEDEGLRRGHLEERGAG